jgi:hypothetical protein
LSPSLHRRLGCVGRLRLDGNDGCAFQSDDV